MFRQGSVAGGIGDSDATWFGGKGVRVTIKLYTQLKLIQREEDLKEQLKELKSNKRVEEARYAASKDMRDP